MWSRANVQRACVIKTIQTWRKPFIELSDFLPEMEMSLPVKHPKSLTITKINSFTTTALKSANLRQRQNLNEKWSMMRIRIFGLIYDMDVSQICPKMLWMYYFVGFSYFTKNGIKRLLTFWEILTNVQKSPIQQWRRKRNKWSGIQTQIKITTES